MKIGNKDYTHPYVVQHRPYTAYDGLYDLVWNDLGSFDTLVNATAYIKSLVDDFGNRPDSYRVISIVPTNVKAKGEK